LTATPPLANRPAQEEVQLLMLRDEQLANFRVTVVLAIVGQGLGLAHLLWRQVNVDVFFVDWEKPRRVLAKGGGREDAAPVSCWRTLLAANEWNELQASARPPACPPACLPAQPAAVHLHACSASWAACMEGASGASVTLPHADVAPAHPCRPGA
jgi:hypothetical protein